MILPQHSAQIPIVQFPDSSGAQVFIQGESPFGQSAQLPDGFQTSEFLLQKGFVDRIVERKNLRAELTLCLEYFTKRCKVNKAGKSSRKQKTA